MEKVRRIKKERTINSIIWGCFILIVAEIIINVIACYYFHKALEIGMMLIRVAWYIIASVLLALPILRKRKRNGGQNCISK